MNTCPCCKSPVEFRLVVDFKGRFPVVQWASCDHCPWPGQEAGEYTRQRILALGA